MPNLDDLKNKLGEAVEGVKDAASDLVEKAGPAASEALENVKSAASDLAEKAGPVASDALENVKSAASDLAEKAAPVASGALDSIKGAAADAGTFLKDKAEELTGQDIDGDGKVGAADGEVVVEEVVEEVVSEGAEASETTDE